MMTLGMEVGLGPCHIVLDGTQLPSPKKGHSPHFSTDVYCGQTAGWIKMPLSTKLGLGPPTLCYMWIQLLQKGHSPKFSAHVYCGQTVAHFSYC